MRYSFILSGFLALFLSSPSFSSSDEEQSAKESPKLVQRVQSDTSDQDGSGDEIAPDMTFSTIDGHEDSNSWAGLPEGFFASPPQAVMVHRPFQDHNTSFQRSIERDYLMCTYGAGGGPGSPPDSPPNMRNYFLDSPPNMLDFLLDMRMDPPSPKLKLSKIRQDLMLDNLPNISELLFTQLDLNSCGHKDCFPQQLERPIQLNNPLLNRLITSNMENKGINIAVITDILLLKEACRSIENAKLLAREGDLLQPVCEAINELTTCGTDPFAMLPAPVINLILSQLSSGTLRNCFRVSQGWNARAHQFINTNLSRVIKTYDKLKILILKPEDLTSAQKLALAGLLGWAEPSPVSKDKPAGYSDKVHKASDRSAALLATIPNEVLILVCKRLPLEDLISVANTNKKFARAAQGVISLHLLVIRDRINQEYHNTRQMQGLHAISSIFADYRGSPTCAIGKWLDEMPENKAKRFQHLLPLESLKLLLPQDESDQKKDELDQEEDSQTE